MKKNEYFLAGYEMFTHNSIYLLSSLIPVTYLGINKAENADSMSFLLCLRISRLTTLTKLTKEIKCRKVQE